MRVPNHGVREDVLVALRATVDKELFYLSEVMLSYGHAALGCITQSADGSVEGLEVVQRHDVTGRGTGEEVRLAAAVVADNRQAKRHCLQEHQTEALVLAGRHKYVRGAQ